MINITHWSAKNYLFFDSAKVPVKKGLTFILGKNRHRKLQNSSNAAGKSLLSGILPSVLFDTHAVVAKGGKAAQRQLYEKTTESEVGFTVGEHTYIYRKAGAKTFLLQDGTDLDSRVAKASFQKLFPLSEEEFFSTVYVDGRRYAGFLLGTSADRYAFFSGLFRLEYIDEIRQSLGKELNDLKSKQLLLDEVNRQIQESKELLAEFPSDTQDLVNALTVRAEALKQKTQESQAELQRHAAFAVYRKTKVELDRIAVPTQSKQEARDTLNAWAVYEDAVVRYKEYLEARKKRQALLTEYSVTQKILDSYDKALKIKELARNHFCEKPDSVEKPETRIDVSKKALVQERLSTLMQRVANINAALKKLKDLKETECPACMQEIPHEHVFSVKSTLTEELQDLAERIATLKKATRNIELLEAHNDYVGRLAKWEQYQKILAPIKDYPFEKVRELQRLPVHKKPEFPVKPEYSKKEAHDAIDAHSRIEGLSKTLATISVDTPKLSKQEVQQKLANYSEKLAQIHKELPILQSNLILQKQEQQKRKDSILRKKDLSETLEDFLIIEMLHRAYSGKGENLRILILAALAKRLESNFNTYSKYVFEEGFTFKILVEPGKFEIVASRRNGKAADIRYFSGAESRLFAVVFLLSILPMIPSSRRCNLLVLDEPTANMDVPSLEIFRDVLLPQLVKLVPSVFVVTPNEELVPQHAKVITVVKENGKATIKSGIQQ